jgi:hypothetical protein
MSTIQIKRGFSQDWDMGSNIINFEGYSAMQKDSIIHCESDTIVFETYTGSRNYEPGNTEKTYCQYLIADKEQWVKPGNWHMKWKVTNLPDEAHIYYQWEGTTIEMSSSGAF